MSLLAPAGLLFLLAIPAVVLLYLLRVRLQEMEVSSTYLWERLLRDLSAQDPWQRPRFTLLMLAQILLLSLLAFALARPAHSSWGPKSVAEVLVIDVSASMQATDVEPNRFAAAKQAALAKIGELPPSSTVALVAAGLHPTVIVPPTQDTQAATAGVEGLAPSMAGVKIEAALGLAQALAGGDGSIDFFTDGAFDPALPPEEPRAVRYHVMGASSNNQGITAIATRPVAPDSARRELFLRLHNYAGRSVATTLVVEADGITLESRDIILPARDSQQLVFDSLPDKASIVSAHLPASDDLPADDTAMTIVEARQPIKMLLVSKGNVFLERALAVVPSVQLFETTPERYPATDADPFDEVVFDGYLPDQAPRQNLLVVNPPASALLEVNGQVDTIDNVSYQSESELLRYVSLKDLRVQRASAVATPGWAAPLIEAQGHPLALAGARQGQRLVIFSFALQQSNLPLLSGFPILMSNVVEYLRPRTALTGHTISTGTPITIQPLAQAETVRVQLPDGTSGAAATGQALDFQSDNQIGIYGVEQSARGKIIARDQFAVNLTDEAESNISPRLAENHVESPEGGQAPRQDELWQWLVVAGIGLLTAEWWWYHRRAR